MNIDIANLAQWLDAIGNLFGIITGVVAAAKAFTAVTRRWSRRRAKRTRRVVRRRR